MGERHTRISTIVDSVIFSIQRNIGSAFSIATDSRNRVWNRIPYISNFQGAHTQKEFVYCTTQNEFNRSPPLDYFSFLDSTIFFSGSDFLEPQLLIWKKKIHANRILSFWYICPNTNHLRKEDKRKLKINQGLHPS